MGSLTFILKRSLINHIKGLKKKPLILVAYILGVIMVIGIGVLAFIIPSQTVSNGSQEGFSAIVSLSIMAITYFTISMGIEKGSSYFRFSDVNFVFTAPVKSNNVLLYGFVKQAPSILLILLMSFFQLPNLKNNFPITQFGFLFILLGIAILMVTLPFITILIYAYASKSKARKKKTKMIFNSIYMLLIVWFAYNYIQTQKLGLALQGVFNNAIFDNFPLLGWVKQIIIRGVYPVDTMFYVYLILSILTIAVFLFVLYKVEPDYYEDVLAGTEHMETLLKAKREGKNRLNTYNTKIKKVKHTFSASGGAAIFQKSMLEIRKTSFFIFDKTTIFIVGFGIGMRYLMPSGDFNSILTSLYMSIYMLLLFAVQGRWAEELSKPYLYLIPSSNFSKLFYATAAENFKNFFDGIILFSISGALFKDDFILIILCIIAYFTFSTIYLYGDVLSRRLFGAVHSKGLSLVLRIFLNVFILLPGFVVSIIMGVIFDSLVLIVTCLIIWNFIASGLLVLAGKNVMDNIEMS